MRKNLTELHRALTPTSSNYFGMNCNINCGQLTGRPQPAARTQPEIGCEVWNLRSSILMPMALEWDVQQSHRGVTFKCLPTFGHSVAFPHAKANTEQIKTRQSLVHERKYILIFHTATSSKVSTALNIDNLVKLFLCSSGLVLLFDMDFMASLTVSIFSLKKVANSIDFLRDRRSRANYVGGLVSFSRVVNKAWELLIFLLMMLAFLPLLLSKL